MNSFVAFVAGILITAGYHSIMDRHEAVQLTDNANPAVPDVIRAYKLGRVDALSTNPVSYELEEVCLQVWANRQPH